MIPGSMRIRLTLWYTGVLALTLIVFAVMTYSFLARSAEQRTDAELADTASAFSNSLETELNDEEQQPEVVVDEVVQGFRFRDTQVMVFDATRRLVAVSNVQEQVKSRVDWQTLPSAGDVSRLIDRAADARPAFSTLQYGGRLRAITVRVRHKDSTYHVVIAKSLHDQQEVLEVARHALYFAIPLALLLASGGGYFLSRKSLAPITAMGIQAASIGSSNLHERLPVQNERDELGKLSVTFNELLSRLQTSFDQQRRFMADASHELRTPVAIVRGEAEVALSKENRPHDDYRVSLQIILEEGQRMTRVVEDLFTIARADAGQYPLMIAAVYLEEIVGDCVRSVRSLAQEREILLAHTAPTVEMPFQGDEGLIRRMLLNLLDNAIKFTPTGGAVSVDAAITEGGYKIKVEDTGPGIPPEAHSRIFERFYRAGKAGDRVGTGSGAGLGLSIARWIAEKHKGQLLLESSNSGGTTFVVLLPCPDK